MIDNENIMQSLIVGKKIWDNVGSSATSEVRELLADSIRLFRYKNQVNILTKAKAILNEKGYDPEKFNFRLLVPLLEYSSLDEDENMQNRWAMLIANATLPHSGNNCIRVFSELLKQMSPKEAKLLDSLFDEYQKETPVQAGSAYQFTNRKEHCDIIGILDGEFYIILDNLFRLNLLRFPLLAQAPPPDRSGSPIIMGRSYEKFEFTELGLAFVRYCKKLQIDAEGE